MSLVNVKVRCGTVFLYDTKVYVDLNEPVSVLKSKICENDQDLHEDLMIVVYCGVDMENHNTIISYNVLEGCTVHVYKRIKREKPSVRTNFSDSDHIRLNVAFRSLGMNSSFSQGIGRLSKPDAIQNFVLSTPGLNEDPLAFTLLLHPELLCKINEIDAVKRLIEISPALASAALKIATTVDEDFKIRSTDPSFSRLFFPRFVPTVDSDSDIVDEIQEMLDDSPPTSEAGTQPVSRNSSFGTITAAQLASAIANVITQQSLPSTSGASTSSGSTDNVSGALSSNIQSQPTLADTDLSTNLQIMRDMGLSNEAVNVEALRVGGDLESAIGLVLSGYIITNDDSTNNA